MKILTQILRASRFAKPLQCFRFNLPHPLARDAKQNADLFQSHFLFTHEPEVEHENCTFPFGQASNCELDLFFEQANSSLLKGILSVRVRNEISKFGAVIPDSIV